MYGSFVKIQRISNNFNPCPAELIYLNFHPLEVVSRYRETQLQVAEKYSYLFNLSICKSRHTFISNISDFGRLIKQIKNEDSRDQQTNCSSTFMAFIVKFKHFQGFQAPVLQ